MIRAVGAPPIATVARYSTSATLAIGGAPTARIIYQSLRAGRFTLSTLLIAALGAIAIGLLEEAAVLAVVFSTGQVLEEYASSRVRRSIHALMALAPPVARRLAPDGSLAASRSWCDPASGCPPTEPSCRAAPPSTRAR